MPKKSQAKRKLTAVADKAKEASANKKSATKATAKKPKTLLDAVVATVDALGGKRSVENAVSLHALKKQLTASRGMDFDKPAAKNQLKKALSKAIDEGKLVKESASYLVPLSREDIEEAWRQQKIVLPIEECNFQGYTGHCSKEGVCMSCLQHHHGPRRRPLSPQPPSPPPLSVPAPKGISLWSRWTVASSTAARTAKEMGRWYRMTGKRCRRTRK